MLCADQVGNSSDGDPDQAERGKAHHGVDFRRLDNSGQPSDEKFWRLCKEARGGTFGASVDRSKCEPSNLRHAHRCLATLTNRFAKDSRFLV